MAENRANDDDTSSVVVGGSYHGGMRAGGDITIPGTVDMSQSVVSQPGGVVPPGAMTKIDELKERLEATRLLEEPDVRADVEELGRAAGPGGSIGKVKAVLDRVEGRTAELALNAAQVSLVVAAIEAVRTALGG